MEDGQVHVDLALPDYKVAFFLDTPAQPGASRSGLDAEGSMLSGWVLAPLCPRWARDALLYSSPSEMHADEHCLLASPQLGGQ